MQNTINWQQFGLRKNPYDTLPLIEGGDIDIEKAFVGRNREKDFLNNLIANYDRSCTTICGDVGVGKTSLANFQKFIWKYTKSKHLFSFRREIEANKDMMNKKGFLLEIIGSIIREIRLLDPKLLKSKTLTKLSRVVDISQTMAITAGGSAFGFGLDFGKESNINNPIYLTTSILEEYFQELIAFIQRENINGINYSGLIIHVNNFDIILSQENGENIAINFFEEIRDILLTQNVHFMFLGPKNLFKDIISARARVKSIFHQTPLLINPLNKKEIIKAFEERMQLLQSVNVSGYIKPIEDDVVYQIYDLYNGDIRAIMASILDILNQNSSGLIKPLTTNESMILLGKERWEKIENVIKLTSEQKSILKYLASAKKLISQKEVVSIFHKNKANISGYYFKPLRDNGIIEEKERKNNTPYYGLTREYIPLKWLVKSQEEIIKSTKIEINQLGLFSRIKK